MAAPRRRSTTSVYGLGRRVAGRFFDFIYPRICPWCQRALTDGESDLACAECARHLPPLGPPLCAVCGIPFSAGEGGHVCAACSEHPPGFDRLRGVVPYNALTAHAIKSLKYHRNTTLARALAKVLLGVENLGLQWCDYDAIVPVPLYPRRLRRRRFNQALLLLWELPFADELPLLAEGLVRLRDTQPQLHLSADQRKENVKGAFAVSPESDLSGKSVLLVDDIASTGATLHECAKVCKKAGAQVVDAAVVARAIVW